MAEGGPVGGPFRGKSLLWSTASLRSRAGEEELQIVTIESPVLLPWHIYFPGTVTLRAPSLLAR